MNCGTCTHYDMDGSPMKAVHMGLCKVDPQPFPRSRTFGATNVCRFGKWQPAAQAVIEKREGKVL